MILKKKINKKELTTVRHVEMTAKIFTFNVSCVNIFCGSLEHQNRFNSCHSLTRDISVVVYWRRNITSIICYEVMITRLFSIDKTVLRRAIYSLRNLLLHKVAWKMCFLEKITNYQGIVYLLRFKNSATIQKVYSCYNTEMVQTQELLIVITPTHQGVREFTHTDEKKKWNENLRIELEPRSYLWAILGIRTRVIIDSKLCDLKGSVGRGETFE